jgi:hypothetical protein
MNRIYLCMCVWRMLNLPGVKFICIKIKVRHELNKMRRLRLCRLQNKGNQQELIKTSLIPLLHNQRFLQESHPVFSFLQPNCSQNNEKHCSNLFPESTISLCTLPNSVRQNKNASKQ